MECRRRITSGDSSRTWFRKEKHRTDARHLWGYGRGYEHLQSSFYNHQCISAEGYQAKLSQQWLR